MNRWLRRYSHNFRAMANECPECGSEKVEATPFCPICGAQMLFDEDNEGQVAYTPAECGREK